MRRCRHSKPLVTSAIENRVVEPFVKWGVPTKEAFEFLDFSGKRWEAKRAFKWKFLFPRQGQLMAVGPLLSPTILQTFHRIQALSNAMLNNTPQFSEERCRNAAEAALSTKTYPAAVVEESWEEHAHSVSGTNKRVRLVLGRSHWKQQFSSQWVFPPVNRCLKLQDEYETAELDSKVEQDSCSVPFNIKSMAGRDDEKGLLVHKHDLAAPSLPSVVFTAWGVQPTEEGVKQPKVVCYR